ncbi:MAG: aminoglycoside phosphotransferase family protein [Anaerolineae bacterium]|nr:aminoglycoside phosphotransferase family protein [Anaerolineae bacterium]
MVTAEERAWAAWRRIHPESTAVRAVEMIQPAHRRSTVVRLEGVPGFEYNIMAKECDTSQAEIEFSVYAEILPHIPHPTLKCLGIVKELSQGSSWLFVEEAVGEVYSHSNTDHQLPAARWLAALHEHAASLVNRVDLEQRDVEHYRNLAEAARETLENSSGNPALSSEQSKLVSDLRRQCEQLRNRVSELQWLFDEFPKTLVHGGFYGKNVRIGIQDALPVVLAYDWESAGWGNPAVDLAYINLDLYGAQCLAEGLRVSPELLHATAILGKMLWVVKAIPGEHKTLASPWLHKVMSKLAYYRDEMKQAMLLMGWEL